MLAERCFFFFFLGPIKSRYVQSIVDAKKQRRRRLIASRKKGEGGREREKHMREKIRKNLSLSLSPDLSMNDSMIHHPSARDSGESASRWTNSFPLRKRVCKGTFFGGNNSKALFFQMRQICQKKEKKKENNLTSR